MWAAISESAQQRNPADARPLNRCALGRVVTGMRILRLLATAAAVAGTTIAMTVVTAPAASAWDNGTYLHTGDVFCTDLASSPTGARFSGHVVNGSATATVRTSSGPGAPQTVVWSGSGANLNINQYVYGSPGTHYQGCVTITAHTQNTWGKVFISGLGAGAVGDIGPHTATLSPGASACGDAGYGPVRLTGTAGAAVTWSVTAMDTDYAYVGTVFSTGGSTVDTTFTPGPELTELEMCVSNTSAATTSVSYELIIL